jgi:hypothetical protein
VATQQLEIRRISRILEEQIIGTNWAEAHSILTVDVSWV